MATPFDRLTAALADRYRIERELGEGGMATVYLAEDLKHRRRVALKVLKPDLAAVVGAERFLAEIETTANLTHPHILPLHESGEADGFLFYVMPYVDGESLRDKLDREHQLPVDEAIRIATDVAEALDHAHRHGVVHRDIKPANIMMQDGRPLVADFGIALAVGTAGSTRLTETGLSVGTPFYMSPEQATGDSSVGPATDVYALACVLYEMLVGEPPFPGATAQAVLGKIIAGGPVSATTVRPSIPIHVDAAIRKALEKLPADRFGSARGFAGALSDPGFRHGVAVGGDPALVQHWQRVAAGLGGLAVILAAVAAWGWFAPEPVEPPAPLRISMQMREGERAIRGSALALSPDGSTLVYQGPVPGDPMARQLYLRRLGGLSASPIPQTEGAVEPAFSPDGRMLSAEIAGRLWVIPLDGSVPRQVADAVSNGSAWSADGRFLYFDPPESLGEEGLRRVPAMGGASERVSAPDTTRGHTQHGWPATLPSMDDHLLVEVITGGVDSVGVLDLSTGNVRVLAGGETPRWSGTGHIVYAVPGNAASRLMALPFDLERLEPTGNAVPLLDNLLTTAGFHSFAPSLSGRMIVGTSPGDSNSGIGLLPVWIDRTGNVEVIDPEWRVNPGTNNRGIDISPDGSRVVLNIGDAGSPSQDIWVKQLPRGPFNRITRDPVEDVRPKWDEDGRHVLYVSRRGGHPDLNQQADIWRQRADGVGEPELVLDHQTNIWEIELAPGGEWLAARVGGEINQIGARDVMIRGPDDEALRPVIASDFDEKAIALSSDGRWLAYESDDTGANQIYVRPFPDVDGGRFPVSERGGTMPKWAHRSNELFFVDGSRSLTAARFEVVDGEFRVTALEPLFTLPENLFYISNENYALYDVAPDDQRFIWMQSTLDRTDFDVILLDDWAPEPESDRR